MGNSQFDYLTLKQFKEAIIEIALEVYVNYQTITIDRKATLLLCCMEQQKGTELLEKILTKHGVINQFAVPSFLPS